MDGYYDPHPRLELEETVAILGHPGSGAAHVAHALSARTGLPFTEVERWTEAAAGRSRARLLLEEGRERLRQLDADALRRAVARRPCGFLSLASDGLEDIESRTLLAEQCCVVFLRRPVEVLLARVQAQVAAAPASLVEFLAGPPESRAALEALLAERAHVERIAAGIVEAGDRHASRIADEILASLSRLTGVRRLGAETGSLEFETC